MILSVAGVRFAYNGRPVLNDLAFEVKAGEIVAVLGINGAGKSTLLKCINRILKPARGTVLLDGHDVHRMSRSESARSFGYVPQHQAREEITVFDAVLLGRRPHIKWAATRRDMEVAERAIGDTGLSSLAMRSVSTLSGGEAQMVLIARALAQEPGVLLLDEPTSNLDVRNQIEVMGLLREVTTKKRLVAMVSIHDLNLSLRFADRFLMLKGGSVYAAVDRRSLSADIIREVYEVDVVMGEVAGHPVAVPVHKEQTLKGERE
jgi:iron complex transport system ATP-binding protein